MQQIFILMIGGIGGAVTTFLLQKYGVSVVVSSCVVGLIGAAIGHFTKATNLPLVIFAGSFVGMTSSSIGTIHLMIIGGALSGLIYKLSLNIFAGFGGRLGTMAFISTIISFYLLLAIKTIFKG